MALKNRNKTMELETEQQQSLLAHNDNGTTLVTSSRKTKPTLYHWDEIPDWQKDNRYIHTGYVRETLSLKACYESLFYLHNETVNIYSHLLPGMTFLSMLLLSLVFFFFPIQVYPTTGPMDYLVLATFVFGLSACLSLSALFHCLKSHSLAVSVLGNKLDYLGIVILIVASAVGIIYYSFVDRIHTALFFISFTLVLGLICAVVSLSDEFRKPSLIGFRAFMFVSFGLSNVFPVLWGLYCFGLQDTSKRCGLKYVLLELFFYISGAAIYAARVPERFLPGKLDYFGHSHQIFHFFVVIAACCHGTALVQSYTHAHEHILSSSI